MSELEDLRRRVHAQRRSLRMVHRSINEKQATIVALYHDIRWRQEIYEELHRRFYRRKLWAVWVWWRNKVVWRVGIMLAGSRRYWEVRSAYDKGYRDGLDGKQPRPAAPERTEEPR
jgi:hypothetical protein